MAFEFRSLCPLLQVFDMPISLRVYGDVLGFQVVSASADGDDANWIWLRRGSADLMLNTAYDPGDRPSRPEPHRVAAHGDTALFFACPDLDAAYQHLTQHRVEVAPPATTPYGMRQMQVSDPDGYELCFQWPASDISGDRWRAEYREAGLGN